MKEPAAIILDFDGVIVESVEIKNLAFGELFRADYPEYVDEILRFQLENVGLSRLAKFPRIFEEILGRPFPDGELGRLDREFSQLVFDGVLHCPLVPGAERFLARRSPRCPLYVASATPEPEVRALVEQRGLAGHFRGVYGAPASKAEILRWILAGSGLEPGAALFVGDAVNDLNAARAVGMPFVGRVPAGGESPFPPDEGIPLVEDLDQLERDWNALLSRAY